MGGKRHSSSPGAGPRADRLLERDRSAATASKGGVLGILSAGEGEHKLVKTAAVKSWELRYDVIRSVR